MIRKDPTTRSQLRAIQYWYTDGIFELGFGLLCLALGGYFFLDHILQGNRFAFLVDIALVAVVVGGSFLMKWLVQSLKERVTFPRTGYVSYSRERSRGQTILAGVIVLGALVLMVFFLSRVELQASARPLVTGILFGIAMIFVGWRTSLTRFYLHGLFSMLLGVGIAFSAWGNHVGLAAFYMVIGLVIIVSGMILLGKYLHQNPAPQEEQDEG